MERMWLYSLHKVKTNKQKKTSMIKPNMSPLSVSVFEFLLHSAQLLTKGNANSKFLLGKSGSSPPSSSGQHGCSHHRRCIIYHFTTLIIFISDQSGQAHQQVKSLTLTIQLTVWRKSILTQYEHGAP